MKISNQQYSRPIFGNYQIQQESLDYLPKKDRQFVKDVVDLCEPFLENATDGMDLTIKVKETKNDALFIHMKKDDKNFNMNFPPDIIKQFQQYGVWFPKFLKTYIEKFQNTVDNYNVGDDVPLHMELMQKYPEVIEECLKEE